MAAAIAIAIVGILVCLVVFLAVRQNRQESHFLKRLSDNLKTVQSGRIATGTLEGTAYEYEYFEGAKNSPAFLKVRIAGLARTRFCITKERAFDRVSKLIGLSDEIQTRDPEFDRDFYIQAERGDCPPGFFTDDQKRRTVREIFALGFTSVGSADGKLEAQWKPFVPREDFAPSVIAETVAKLVAFRGEAPTVPGTPMSAERRGLKSAWAAALLGATVVAMLGPAWYPPLDGWDLFIWSMKYSTTAMLILLFLAVARLRGRSTAHRELLAILIASVIGFPLGGWGTAAILNGYLDASPPLRHVAQVVDKRASKGKHRSYHAIVESWRPTKRRETIRVGARTYRGIVSKESKLIVQTKRGRFGFEWLVGYEVWKQNTAGAEPAAAPDAHKHARQ